ncbi:hypothetical protein LOTGIDRAFT_238416 [Lottia gigantea]|uniref:Uncharacterized protein n=1 Tax=Lottia gigantea TaxID=225164 RepID=V4CFW9_LOTGI|nr:hypothetical protein LOTGIDRAFT_238416 [Lottia gigantea]ESP00935.1 hypothetical protein LOTGIDRAFT_238416 [Lottia gigantea]
MALNNVSISQQKGKGLSNDQFSSWTENVRHQPVKDLKLPTWNKCGRDKNRYVVLKDGTALCARYRHPLNKLVLGEVLSFYLSKLLKMDNVPAVVLSQLNQSSHQWNQHNLTAVDWQTDQYVALIQWIPDMDTRQSYVYMPSQILEGLESKSVVDVVSLADDNLTPTVLSQLVQWGSMIIYDYLTANYDRVGSMQDGAFREKDPSILKEHIRNLRKSVKTSKLWLIDNESGLLDAYDLLYKSGQNGKQFVTFHQQMLQTMCIFEKPLVKAIRSLHNTPEPYQTLENFARQHEPLLDQVPKDNSYSLFKTMFSKRLTDVYEWIQFCQSRQL